MALSHVPSALTAVAIIQPEAIIRWHSDGIPSVLALEVAFAGWSDKDSGSDPAPDPRDESGQSTMARTGIRGELLKLGIEVAQSSVAKYMAKGGRGQTRVNAESCRPVKIADTLGSAGEGE